jgi:hypothetical protein
MYKRLQSKKSNRTEDLNIEKSLITSSITSSMSLNKTNTDKNISEIKNQTDLIARKLEERIEKVLTRSIDKKDELKKMNSNSRISRHKDISDVSLKDTVKNLTTSFTPLVNNNLDKNMEKDTPVVVLPSNNSDFTNANKAINNTTNMISSPIIIKDKEKEKEKSFTHKRTMSLGSSSPLLINLKKADKGEKGETSFSPKTFHLDQKERERERERDKDLSSRASFKTSNKSPAITKDTTNSTTSLIGGAPMSAPGYALGLGPGSNKISTKDNSSTMSSNTVTKQDSIKDTANVNVNVNVKGKMIEKTIREMPSPVKIKNLVEVKGNSSNNITTHSHASSSSNLSTDLFSQNGFQAKNKLSSPEQSNMRISFTEFKRDAKEISNKNKDMYKEKDRDRESSNTNNNNEISMKQSSNKNLENLINTSESPILEKLDNYSIESPTRTNDIFSLDVPEIPRVSRSSRAYSHDYINSRPLNDEEAEYDEEDDVIYYYITEADNLTEIAEVDELNESDPKSFRQKSEKRKGKNSQKISGKITERDGAVALKEIKEMSFNQESDNQNNIAYNNSRNINPKKKLKNSSSSESLRPKKNIQSQGARKKSNPNNRKDSINLNKKKLSPNQITYNINYNFDHSYDKNMIERI